MMSEVPFMRMWWGDFFADPKVAAMPGETRGIYACLLGAMWQNGGWLPNNDSIIARLLGLHVLTWKARHRPLILPLLLHRDVGTVVGGVLTQKRLTSEWGKAIDQIDVTKKKLAKARAEKAAKSRNRASMPERENGPMPEPMEAPSTASMHSSDLIAQKIEQGAALTAERPVLSRSAVDAGSLRPANGHDDDEQPSDPELVRRLVKAGLKREKPTGLMAALWQEVEDDNGDDEA